MARRSDENRHSSSFNVRTAGMDATFAVAGRSVRLHGRRAGTTRTGKTFGGERTGRASNRDSGRRVPGPVVLAFVPIVSLIGGNQLHHFGVAPGGGTISCSASVCRWSNQRFGLRRRGQAWVFGAKSPAATAAIAHVCWHSGFLVGRRRVHSGDMGFELCYLRGIAPARAGAIAKRPTARSRTGFEGFSQRRTNKGRRAHILMDLAMCADPTPDSHAYMGVRLPVDLQTARLIPETLGQFPRTNGEPGAYGGTQSWRDLKRRKKSSTSDAARSINTISSMEHGWLNGGVGSGSMFLCLREFADDHTERVRLPYGREGLAAAGRKGAGVEPAP